MPKRIVEQEQWLSHKDTVTPSISRKEVKAMKDLVRWCKKHNTTLQSPMGNINCFRLQFLKVSDTGAYLMKTDGRRVGRVIK
jgi:hypothetical protein